MEQKETSDRVQRVRKKLLGKKPVKPAGKLGPRPNSSPDANANPKTKSKTKGMAKKLRRQQQREALRKQVLKYCDEDGYIRTPIPNELFVECLKLQLLRRETRETPCPRGFPEWWFVKLQD